MLIIIDAILTVFTQTLNEADKNSTAACKPATMSLY